MKNHELVMSSPCHDISCHHVMSVLCHVMSCHHRVMSCHVIMSDIANRSISPELELPEGSLSARRRIKGGKNEGGKKERKEEEEIEHCKSNIKE